MHGKVSDKIDVYAFGVVLLELLSGRKPIISECPKGQESLVMWVCFFCVWKSPYSRIFMQLIMFLNFAHPKGKKNSVFENQQDELPICETKFRKTFKNKLILIVKLFFDCLYLWIIPLDSCQIVCLMMIYIQAKPILNGGKVFQLLDPSLGSNYEDDQIERMVLAATLCIRREPRLRPQISLVSLLDAAFPIPLWFCFHFYML